MSSVALTGTPGTGKSTVASRLGPDLRVLEVLELGRNLGTARRRRGQWTVDLSATAEAWRSRRSPPADVVVGHLAHLLPIRDAVVLRCHPRELEIRFAQARRGTTFERRENLVAEATDAILLEAIGLGRRIWEVDTTGRTVDSVVREVRNRIRRRGPSAYGTVDWLSDAWVGEHLLDWSP